MANLMKGFHEWSSRPDDQRYLSMAELRQAVAGRKAESWTATPDTRELRVHPMGEDGADIGVDLYDPSAGEQRTLGLSHWSFGQLCTYAQTPAAYIRRLPAQLASINLQYGLEFAPVRDNSLVLAQSNGSDRLRSMTSVSYGRIWDLDVVDAVDKVNHDGRWVIPASSYSFSHPKRATTLYASDRDVFVFLVDPKNPVEVEGEQLFRGFYAWNSEVGAATFGLTTFLYRTICDNRIVLNATDVRELRIRHTRSAPERFAYEGARYLHRYAEESTAKIAESIKQAKSREVPINEGTGETVADWLRKRGFSKSEATASVDTARAEEGSARTLWDIVNGVTAYARSVPHTDARIALEAKAGALMKYAS